MQLIRKGVLYTLLSFFGVIGNQSVVLAQQPDVQLYKQLYNYPFVFVSDSVVTTPPVISDSLFDEIARGIRFQVNRTELQKGDPFISLYNDSLVPWLKKHNLILREVFVKGAASPEGPYQNNVRLSCERAKRLIEFLSSNLDQPIANRPTNSKCVTEDYAYLVKLMQKAGDAEYQQVKAIWDASKGDELYCKKKLMALNGGTTWKRLLKVYFPTLRQSRLVLWFAVNPKHAPAARPKLTAAPKLAPMLTPTPQYFRTSHAGLLDIPGIANYVSQPVPVDTPVVKQYTRRHMIALRTNLLHDFLYVPQFGLATGGNIQLEYYPLSGHYTFNAGFTFHNHRHWDSHKFFQTRDVQLEVRRYFKGQGQFLGTYLGAYAQGTVYGIGFSATKGWEGEGGGAGLTIGHTCKLNKKGSLRLEFSLSAGAFVTVYDPYVWGNPINGTIDGLYYYDYHGSTSKFKERNHRFAWFGPTNAGIHLTYDIIYRKKKEVTR